MGLDMFLYQLKKIDNEDNIEDIIVANAYYSFKRNTSNKDSLNSQKELEEFFEYSGYDYDKFNFDIVKKYHSVFEKNNPLDDEIIYWRKANAIHNHLLKNSLEFDKEIPYEDYNCKYLTILSETLIDLRDRCQIILDNSEIVDGDIEVSKIFRDDKIIPVYAEGKIIKDSKIAEYLLPTRDGFFHGSMDYDEYYIESLKYTIEDLNELFEQDGWDDYIYLYYPYW